MRTDSQPQSITIDYESLRAVIREAVDAALAAAPSKSPEQLLTKSQVAEYLNVSVRTVDTLVAEGELIPVHVRTARRFTRESIDRYLRPQTRLFDSLPRERDGAGQGEARPSSMDSGLRP